jgi:hypothetical protein
VVGPQAVQIAFGPSGKQADTTGALQEIASHPGGIVVLWLLAAGFAGLALWRAHRGRPAGRPAPAAAQMGSWQRSPDPGAPRLPAAQDPGGTSPARS